EVGEGREHLGKAERLHSIGGQHFAGMVDAEVEEGGERSAVLRVEVAAPTVEGLAIEHHVSGLANDDADHVLAYPTNALEQHPRPAVLVPRGGWALRFEYDGQT